MSFPFTQFPTVAEFLQAAQESGCTLGESQSVILGPRGPFRCRYLRSPNSRVIVPILMDEGERLTPTVLASFARRLKVYPFRDLYQHLLDAPN